MKLTKSKLKQIIKEEMQNFLIEQHFDNATGQPLSKAGEQMCADGKPPGCAEKWLIPILDAGDTFSPATGQKLIDLFPAGVIGSSSKEAKFDEPGSEKVEFDEPDKDVHFSDDARNKIETISQQINQEIEGNRPGMPPEAKEQMAVNWLKKKGKNKLLKMMAQYEKEIGKSPFAEK